MSRQTQFGNLYAPFSSGYLRVFYGKLHVCRWLMMIYLVNKWWLSIANCYGSRGYSTNSCSTWPSASLQIFLHCLSHLPDTPPRALSVNMEITQQYCWTIFDTLKKTSTSIQVGNRLSTSRLLWPIGSMYAIYGDMDPINIPQSC